MKAVFIDVETCGLDHRKNGIIQLSGSVCQIDGTNIIEGETFNYMIQPFPNDIIEDGALTVNKVTREELKSYPPAKEVYNSFTQMLSKYCDKYDKTDKMFFIGYNARFDYDFCRSWFEKLGDKYFGSWFYFPPIDVMNSAIVELMKERHLLENFKLATVCEHLGIKIDTESLHDADFDIKLTIALFQQIIKRGQ